MLPSLVLNTLKISSSISLSFFLFSAPVMMSLFFSSSRSGLSFATTMPSSWSSRPSGVVTKFSKFTFTQISGG